MSYRLVITSSAMKDLARLHPRVREQANAHLEALAEEPRPRDSRNLKGRFKNSRRLRMGDYRIGYTVDDDERVIRVIAVGPRESFYERMK